MTKRTAILIVIIITVILSALLLSQADADSSKFDDRVRNALHNGGTVRTMTMAKWELHRYAEERIPKMYPCNYTPWESYVLIDQYVTVDSELSYNVIRIDSRLYETLQPKAEENKALARKILRKYKVKGTGKKAYFKIRRYILSGRYIKGVKSANGFFRHHGGDCASHAAAVYVLCKAQGIPVRYCIGAYESSLHAWNRVKLNGTWYWADETMEMWLSKKLWYGYKKPNQMW